MSRLESHTTIIEREGTWDGAFETEPYEASWAREAIFFIRAWSAEGVPNGASARVQISPDGMRWCDEGSSVPLPTTTDGLTFGRVSHFGGWLRLVGAVPGGGSLRVLVYLTLKS
jgi:hypothetical protein